MKIIFLVQIFSLILFCEGQNQDLSCDEGKTCVDKDTCESFVAENAKLKQFKKGTSEWNTLLTQLKKQICNKKEKKVCCKSEPPTEKLPKRMNDSSNSSYLPNPLTGECGLSGTGADFILGLSDKLKNKQRN